MNQMDSAQERVRLTEHEAFANLRTVLELCAQLPAVIAALVE